MTPAMVNALPPDLILEIAVRAGLAPRRIGGDEFVVRCPSHAGHRDGDRHPSCRLNPLKGTYYCDPCGKGGGLVDFARAVGVDLGLLTGPHPRRALSRPRIVHFESAGPITREAQEAVARSISKTYPPAVWLRLNVEEGTVGSEPAIAIPLSSGGYKVCLYRLPDPKRKKPYTFLFADGGQADLLMVGEGTEVLLTAGEWDMLAALSAGFETVATGTGGEGCWKEAWSSRFAGKTVHVCYDVDEAGRAGAAKVAERLRHVANAVHIVNLPLSGDQEQDGKDLSDYLAQCSPTDLRRLLDQTTPLESESPAEGAAEVAGSEGTVLSKITVADIIDAILSMKGPIRLKRRDAAKLVIDDLCKRGELVHSGDGRLFWFNREGQRLLDLDGFGFRSLFLKDYRVNPAEREFVHIMEAVKSAARSDGRRVQVCRFCFYDRSHNRLYIHGGRARVLRLDGQSVSWVDNGTDEVLFEDDNDFEVIPEAALSVVAHGDPIHDLIVGRVNFIRGSAVILSAEQQQLVLRVWILSIFFPELLPSKCLLLLYGEKGSGKTTTLRVILKLLLGPHANVTPLTKEDGFNAAVSSEYLLVLDNVDSFCRWIEDRLATVATGQTIRLRKLYTTNEVLSFATRCCLALTARTPRFRRDDVVDRLQILRVARLERFSREADWYAEIEAHRAVLWGQLLRDLNAVITLLGDAAAGPPETIRLADWAFVATTVGDALGLGDAVREALEASELDKAHFLLEADELYDLLDAIANESPFKLWKAGELFAELKRRAEQADVEFSVRSPRSLGRILHRLKPALQRMISFEIVPSTHDGQALYSLGPLARQPRPEGDLGLSDAPGRSR